MAGEIFAEALALVGQLAIEAGAIKFRIWRDESHFESLDEEAKRAFLEVVIAAILADGHESELERAWLARREEVGAARALIDEALATVRAALPPGASLDARAAFVGARHDALGDEETRERAFANAARILLASGGAGAVDEAKAFGMALGLSEGDASSAITKVQTRPMG